MDRALIKALALTVLAPELEAFTLLERAQDPIAAAQREALVGGGACVAPRIGGVASRWIGGVASRWIGGVRIAECRVPVGRR